MQNNRYVFLDEIKGTAMLMIMAAHLCNASGVSNPIRQWYDPFMVGIFFCVSGGLYALKGGEKRKAADFIRRRTATLLLPYAGFCAAAGILQVFIASERGLPPGPEAIRILTDCATGKGLGPMWFLPVMFLAELLFYGCMRIGRAGIVLTILSAAAALYGGGIAAKPAGAAASLLFNLYAVCIKALVGNALMLTGYYILPIFVKTDGSGSSDCGKVLCTGTAAFAVTIFISRIYGLDFNQLDFGRYPVLLILDSTAATIFLLLLFRLADPFHEFRLLQYLGRSTLILLCTHTEWYLVPIITCGWAQIAGQAAVPGERYYLELLLKLALLTAAETGIIEAIRALKHHSRI